ncbi:MAG: hypothetical protein UX59_C0037G0007 [Microgenomates group bacterium GW2011_GWA1_46_7]|nr:MAG: hypothetical protein UX59_C0037G0007 [Microgenomates group bacterium GW2011_GWA1_46_7]
MVEFGNFFTHRTRVLRENSIINVDLSTKENNDDQEKDDLRQTLESLNSQNQDGDGGKNEVAIIEDGGKEERNDGGKESGNQKPSKKEYQE